MVFAPTPPRTNLPAQLLPLSSITATAVQQSGGSSGSSSAIAIIGAPTNGTVGIAWSLVGTVSPTATAVQVGLSASASVAPASWVAASVSGTGWTASVSPSGAGTIFIWAEQTAMPSVQAISTAVIVAAGSAVVINSPPTTGTAGIALSLAGTVSPAGAAVRVGLATSATVAPVSWVSATVAGSGWTAALTPATSGTYYFWAEQTGSTGVQAVSAAVTVAASGGSGLSYSLISGSGNGSLTGMTLSTTVIGSAPATDWSSSIAPAATDVAPNATVSAIGSITTAKFWFDTTNTGVTPGTYGNALLSGNNLGFYANSDGFGTPTCAPAAPSSGGTYYGKYAFYNSSNTLLGVFSTSAITVT